MYAASICQGEVAEHYLSNEDSQTSQSDIETEDEVWGEQPLKNHKHKAATLKERWLSGKLRVVQNYNKHFKWSWTLRFPFFYNGIRFCTCTVNYKHFEHYPKELCGRRIYHLVFDNIDFGKEISKQTHVTNGIITQKITIQNKSEL